MDHQHPFFGEENLALLRQQVIDRVREETHETIAFPLTREFTDGMVDTAREYSGWLRTADLDEGLRKLNDVVVRRTLRRLTEPDEAGQYSRGNTLYNLTRRGRKCNGLRRQHLDGPEDLDDPAIPPGTIVTHNPYRHRVAEWHQRDKALQQRVDAFHDAFKTLRPETHWTADRAFREL